MTRSGDCTGVRSIGYGCLFSVADWGRGQQRQRNVQALAQVHGGIVRRQAIGRSPLVESVAAAAALEAVKRVGLGVDAEATCRAVLRAVQGAGTTLLALVVGARHKAQQGEHLDDGDGGTHGGEVEGGAGRIATGLQLVVLGLPQRFPAFAGLGELAVDADPRHKTRDEDVGLVGPGADKIDELVARVVGNPAFVQCSPCLFFSR